MMVAEVLKNMTFGEMLKTYRKQAGLSAAALAAKSGVTRAAIIEYEGDRRSPSFESGLALAKALGVSCEVFSEVEFRYASQKGKPKTSDDNQSEEGGGKKDTIED